MKYLVLTSVSILFNLSSVSYASHNQEHMEACAPLAFATLEELFPPMEEVRDALTPAETNRLERAQETEALLILPAEKPAKKVSFQKTVNVVAFMNPMARVSEPKVESKGAPQRKEKPKKEYVLSLKEERRREYIADTGMLIGCNRKPSKMASNDSMTATELAEWADYYELKQFDVVRGEDPFFPHKGVPYLKKGIAGEACLSAARLYLAVYAALELELEQKLGINQDSSDAKELETEQGAGSDRDHWSDNEQEPHVERAAVKARSPAPKLSEAEILEAKRPLLDRLAYYFKRYTRTLNAAIEWHYQVICETQHTSEFHRSCSTFLKIAQSLRHADKTGEAEVRIEQLDRTLSQRMEKMHENDPAQVAMNKVFAKYSRLQAELVNRRQTLEQVIASGGKKNHRTPRLRFARTMHEATVVELAEFEDKNKTILAKDARKPLYACEEQDGCAECQAIIRDIQEWQSFRE